MERGNSPYMNIRPISQQNNNNQQGKPPRQEKNIDLLLKKSNNIIQQSKQLGDGNYQRGRVGLPPLANLNDYKQNLDRLNRNSCNNSVHSQRINSTEDLIQKVENDYSNYFSNQAGGQHLREKVKRNLSERGKLNRNLINISSDNLDEAKQKLNDFNNKNFYNLKPPCYNRKNSFSQSQSKKQQISQQQQQNGNNVSSRSNSQVKNQQLNIIQTRILNPRLGSRQNSYDEDKKYNQQQNKEYLEQLYCKESVVGQKSKLSSKQSCMQIIRKSSSDYNREDQDEDEGSNFSDKENLTQRESIRKDQEDEKKKEKSDEILQKHRSSSSSGTNKNNILNDITNLIKQKNLNQAQWNINEKMAEFPPSVTARCWVLYDLTSGKYLEGKSPYSQRQVASLTKIMTFYTTVKVFEQLQYSNYLHLQFRVTKYASSMNGTSARLKENTWITLKDLFYALMLPSGNDAAIVLAENMGYILQLMKKYSYNNVVNYLDHRKDIYEGLMESKCPIFTFINEMNKNAKTLNMCLTNYSNPHGLMHKENKSSAYDIGRLCCEAMQIPIIKEVVSTIKYRCKVELDDRYFEMEWENTNKLLAKQGWIGVKTGITDAAGPCLASCFSYTNPQTQQNKKYLVILLCSKSMDIRWSESEQLVQWQIRQDQRNF